MSNLLQICEKHSYNLGHRWNPSKYVVLNPANQLLTYYLYWDPLPARSSFPYLGAPIRPGVYLHTFELITNNINKSLETMNQLAMIGLKPDGFDQLLATRFYKQIVWAQLEYGLAISKVISLLSNKLEDAQNICLRRNFGSSSRSSIKVMLQLTKLPTMTERVHILQAQFLLRSLSLPDDTLLACLLPHIRLSKGHSQWYTISKNPLLERSIQYISCLDKRLLKKLRLQYLQDNLEQRRAARNSGLLSLRRPKISLDPILWLPMSRIDRSRCVRWRLGWLSGYKTVPCARHQSELFTKQHAIHCLNIHRRLQIQETTTDPLSFLLNRLPNSKPRSRQVKLFWSFKWPILCSILQEMGYLYHKKVPLQPANLGKPLINWLHRSCQKCY